MRRALMCSVASIGLNALTLPALAQEAPPSTSPAPSTNSPATLPETDTAAADAQTPPEQGLGDIIVTAQRRAENLQRAAVPVDVVSAEALLKTGVTDPSALGTLVPALSVNPAGGNRANFFLRGVGNFTANPTFDSAIAFNYDGVYIGRPGSTSGLFYDLERIEVLKGPQGTLYGRNATGGAINVLPVRPKIGQVSGYVTGSYGNYDAIATEGAINLPLGTSGAIRVSGAFLDRDGYLTDGTSDEETRALRFQMMSELTPDLTVRVSADYAHSGGRGPGISYDYGYRFDPTAGQFILADSGLGPKVGAFDPRAQTFRQSLRAGPAGRNLTGIDRLPFIDNDFYGANAELNYDTGFGSFTVIPAWRFAKQDNVAVVQGFAAGVKQKDEQFSLEARFVGDRIGPIDYTLGAYYFYETNKGSYAVGQQALFNTQQIAQRTKSYASFGRVTAHLSDTFRVVGGLRYTADRKRFAGQADSLVIICAAPACPTVPLFPSVDRIEDLGLPIIPSPGGVAPIPGTGAIVARLPALVVNARLPKNRFTYRGAVEFDVAERSLLYASVETGFRSGGFSLATGFETYQPEYLTAYTVGSKNRFFDNRLQLNIEGFYWKYRDQQLAYIGLDRGGRQGFFTQNIGRAEIYGVDAESRLLVTPTTAINAQVQYLRTKYQGFAYQVPTGMSPPFTGCATSVNATAPAFTTIDCSGQPAFNSPKWTVNVGGDQTFNVGDYKLIATADTQYRSSRVVGFQYQPGQVVGSTWQTNAQLGFGPADDGWSIAGFVRNIENNRYAVGANDFAIGSALVIVTNPPRTYGVRGTVRF